MVKIFCLFLTIAVIWIGGTNYVLAGAGGTPKDVNNWNWDIYSYAIRYGPKGEEKVTFNSCHDLCASDGHEVLDIYDDKEFKVIDDELIHDKVNNFWTSGLRDSIDGTYYWPMNEENIPPPFWADEEPKKAKGNKVCVELKWDPKSKYHKLFMVDPCEGRRTCICKKHATSESEEETDLPPEESMTTAPPPPTTVPPPPTTIRPTARPLPPPLPANNARPPILPPSVTTAQPPKSKPKPVKFKCPSEGMFPDPNTCEAFHQCVQDGTAFRDYKMPCGPGTVYCPDLQICGWERDCPCSL